MLLKLMSMMTMIRCAWKTWLAALGLERVLESGGHLLEVGFEKHSHGVLTSDFILHMCDLQELYGKKEYCKIFFLLCHRCN